MAELDFTPEELEGLSRKDLQALAKRNGIKANLKSAAIIELLIEHYNEHCAVDKENSSNDANTEPEGETATPNKEEVMEEVTEAGEKKEAPMEVEEEKVEKMEEEPVVPSTPPKKVQPLVSPSPIRRTLPKNPVPPSPMQKFTRNATAALTPRKTPLRPSQTPAKDLYMITPRKHINKKNLFSAPAPSKQAEEASAFEVIPFEDLKDNEEVAVSVFGFYTVMAVLSDGGILLADFASVSFVAKALTAFAQSIVKQAMKLQEVTEREGFILEREFYNAALELVLTGELAKNALEESNKIRTRYNDLKNEEWDGKLLGLSLDHEHVEKYLESVGVTAATEDVLALTACMEYISCEIWELSEKKELDAFDLIQLDAVIEAIKGDDELNFTFKTQIAREAAMKSVEPAIIKQLPSLVSKEGDGASQQAIKSLETALRFPLPRELKALLSLRDGDAKLGIDSCTTIERSTIAYEEVSIVYSLLNWIPIRTHHDDDVWDCYDTYHGIVVRASMLPQEENDQVYPSAYKVIAHSFEEYIKKHSQSSSEFLESSGAKTLHEVCPNLANVAQFWINITDEDPVEEQ